MVDVRNCVDWVFPVKQSQAFAQEWSSRKRPHWLLAFTVPLSRSCPRRDSCCSPALARRDGADYLEDTPTNFLGSRVPALSGSGCRVWCPCQPPVHHNSLTWQPVPEDQRGGRETLHGARVALQRRPPGFADNCAISARGSAPNGACRPAPPRRRAPGGPPSGRDPSPLLRRGARPPAR
jgi:hypothetical protein